MKIGIVLSKTPQYSETFFISKIKGLQKHGHYVTLFVQNKQEGFSLCEVKKAPKLKRRNLLILCFISLKILLKSLFNLQPIIQFIKLERKEGKAWFQVFKNIINNSHILFDKLDWLHFGFTTLAIQSEHVAKAIGAKMAISLRGFDMSIYPLSHSGCYDLVWKHVDKVHTISDDLLHIAYNLGLSSSVTVVKITPAIDTKFFNGISNVISENDKLNFLTVARLHWKKGLIYTLEALSILKAKKLKFHYHIIGVGRQAEEIKYSIYQLDLQDYVTLLGVKTPGEVREYMKEASIYLQYSVSEGFCNSVLEAQAMGLLCIAGDAEGLSENILHGKTGWVVPKRDPKVLAKTIIDVIQLPEEEKKSIMHNAKKRVIKSFNLENQKKAFLKFYE